MTDSTAGDRPELLPARRRLPAVPESPEMREWAEALVERARPEGVALTAEGGVLTALMGQVLQTGLDVELDDRLGYGAYDPAGRGSGNSRNGGYTKTVNTELDPVEVRMPRDRAGTFEPATIPKHVRRVDGLSGNVISLRAGTRQAADDRTRSGRASGC